MRTASHATRHQSAGHLTLAREERAPFDASPADRSAGDADDAPTDVDAAADEVGQVAELLTTTTDRLASLDVDALDDRQLEALIAPVQRHLDRITAARDRLIGARQRRAIRAAGPGREERAIRATARQLADELRLSPGEAMRAGRAGRDLLDRPQLSAAVDDGSLRPAQAKVIGDLLDQAPPDAHTQLTDELVAAARTQGPVELGATARRRLAEVDQDAAVRAEQRRHARRRATIGRSEDGMLDLHAQVAGLDAEVVATAVHAFRTVDPPDGPGRTAEQRTADAVVAVCRAALDGDAAAADRRVRPHLIVTVDLDDLTRRTGVAEGRWAGPIPTTQLEEVARESTIRVLGVDVRGLPIALSRATDHPTSAQYLALAHRDGGCRYPGCDAPAAWCDIAHATARRHRGRIEPSNSLLLCREHHRRLDLGKWTITIDPATAEATFTGTDGRTVRARAPRGHRPPRGHARSTATDPPNTS